MNYILVETWEAFKISSATINQEAFKKTHLPTLYPWEKSRNHQTCLVDTQIHKYQKADYI